MSLRPQLKDSLRPYIITMTILYVLKKETYLLEPESWKQLHCRIRISLHAINFPITLAKRKVCWLEVTLLKTNLSATKMFNDVICVSNYKSLIEERLGAPAAWRWVMSRELAWVVGEVKWPDRLTFFDSHVRLTAQKREPLRSIRLLDPCKNWYCLSLWPSWHVLLFSPNNRTLELSNYIYSFMTLHLIFYEKFMVGLWFIIYLLTNQKLTHLLTHYLIHTRNVR